MGNSRRFHHASAFAALVFLTGATDGPPAFAFRDLTAGELVDMSKVRGCDRPKGGVTVCTSFFPVAECPATAIMRFKDGYLGSIYLDLPRRCIRDVRMAFLAKYGEPASDSVVTTTWRFATGDLMLSPYRGAGGNGSAFYLDREHPPEGPPKVDF